MSTEHGSYPPFLNARETMNASQRAEEMHELITSRDDLRQLEENVRTIFAAVELGLVPWDIAVRVLHGLSTVKSDNT